MTATRFQFIPLEKLMSAGTPRDCRKRQKEFIARMLRKSQLCKPTAKEKSNPTTSGKVRARNHEPLSGKADKGSLDREGVGNA